MIVPAVMAGLFLVFGVGYVVTCWALTKLAKRGNRAQKVKRLRLTEDNIDRAAKVAGIAAVLLVLLSLFVVPRPWLPAIWLALTALGIVCAVCILALCGGA